VRQGAGWTVHRRRSRCPTRPVSSPSTVRLSGYLVRTRLSGRLVSSPSGVRRASVRPAGVSPSARSHPSRPASASGSDGDTRYGGATVTTGSSRVPCGPAQGTVPGGSVDGPMRHRCGHRCGGLVEAGGGRRPADLGRVVLWREAAADRSGRPDRRQGVRRWRRRSGRGAADAMLPHGTVWSGHLAWSRDYAAWSARSLMSEWTGPEDQTSSAARMARGPSAAQPGSRHAGSTPTTP
jgi:hypothetical protein